MACVHVRVRVLDRGQHEPSSLVTAHLISGHKITELGAPIRQTVWPANLKDPPVHLPSTGYRYMQQCSAFDFFFQVAL